MTHSLCGSVGDSFCLWKTIWKGNCEEELPKKLVGQLSVDCQPADYRKVINRLPTAN